MIDGVLLMLHNILGQTRRLRRSSASPSRRTLPSGAGSAKARSRRPRRGYVEGRARDPLRLRGQQADRRHEPALLRAHYGRDAQGRMMPAAPRSLRHPPSAPDSSRGPHNGREGLVPILRACSDAGESPGPIARDAAGVADGEAADMGIESTMVAARWPGPYRRRRLSIKRMISPGQSGRPGGAGCQAGAAGRHPRPSPPSQHRRDQPGHEVARRPHGEDRAEGRELPREGTPVTVLRCAGMADGSPGPIGEYLVAYDPLTTAVEWSPDRSKAKDFVDVVDAHKFWTQVHPTLPTRPWDGQPNRPLTVYSVSVDA